MWEVRCLAFYISKQVTTKAKELKDSITCSPGEFPPYPFLFNVSKQLKDEVTFSPSELVSTLSLIWHGFFAINPFL